MTDEMVGEVEQRYGLAAQRIDDVTIVDGPSLRAVGEHPATRQGEEVRAADDDLEPIVVEADAELVADQPHGTV